MSIRDRYIKTESKLVLQVKNLIFSFSLWKIRIMCSPENRYMTRFGGWIPTAILLQLQFI